MRARSTLLAATMIVVAFIPAPGRAATGRTIQVFNNYFTERVTIAVASDPVTIAFRDGIHNVSSYTGQPISTGDRASGSQVSVIFNGGTTKFRCVIHSSLTETGVCSGMCGWLSDKPVDLQPPSVMITQPTQRQVVVPTPSVNERNQIVNVVDFKGAAVDETSLYGVGLRIYDVAGRAKDYPATCDGCPLWYGEWSARVTLTPGYYSVRAIAADSAGNISTPAQIQIVVV